MMLDHREYSNSSEATEEEYTTPPPRATKRKNKKRISRNKRRFSDTQIKSLESMFETESRLEPVKKLELARELGLQPRQVAIWFQNKRARWKSKQLERDYNILLANHNNLASRFDALKKDHQALLIQLQKLKDGMQKPLLEHKEAANGMEDSEAENANTVKNEKELVVKPTPSPSSDRSEHVRGAEDETGLLNLNLVEHAGNSLILPPEDYWGIFDSNNLFDQSTIDYQWWDFWS